MSREQFFDSTLRELFREFVVAKRRWEDDRQRDVHLAWQCVRIFIMSHKSTATGTQLRLPELRTLLDLPVRRQSLDQLEHTLRFLSTKTGFPIIEVPVGQ